MPMLPFTIAIGDTSETFRPIQDFVEGDTRHHWTLVGLEKLIRLGLWRRDFDRRGNLKSKPMTVEAAMKLTIATRVT